MASSARYEDLHDDLENLMEKVKLRLQQDISEGTLNGLLSEGDGMVLLMKKEVDLTPFTVRNEMQSRWSLINGEWASFKRTAKTTLLSPPTAIRYDGGLNNPLNPTMVRGTSIMERTGQSIFRATQVAQESEQIGTEVIGELGVQREALSRTRDRMGDTNQDLKKTSVLIRSMNRRVLTNKCLLFVIIILECAILGAQVYWKWLRKK